VLNKYSHDIALLLIRLGIGVVFLAHGLQKFGAFNGPGVENFSVMLKNIGFVPPMFWAYLVSGTEVIAGLTLILGVLPRISAFSISIIALVAIVKVHGPHGFFMANNGMEYLYLIFLTSLALMLTGGGKFSLYDKF